ncbi:hypothetical protein [Nocardia sp. CC227C]|uniref:hypothetical protein n=1 Tax=Nocardia sp. CC227C TaxID=3044562 RepID=UPI00278C3FB4|nr:hypothetical protein [Nocardia sp. CC227C]
MKVDDRGRLWVTDSTAGVAAYDIATRALVASFDVPGGAPRFVNDLDSAPDGTAYLTDSIRSVVYRVTPDQVAAGGMPNSRRFSTSRRILNRARRTPSASTASW